MRCYNSGDYFNAHEHWEELWSDYYLEDRKFIQGLIQLAVSFVHLQNGNLKGAKSLLKKCEEKFLRFSDIQRGIDVSELLEQISVVSENYNSLKNLEDFDWDLVPNLDYK
tara:strand:+ start:1017 stop:1346 length:330 start_codon:yes stop_codon:yes gene_type:complete